MGPARQRVLLLRGLQHLGKRPAEQVPVKGLLSRAPVMQLDELVRARPMPADVFVHPARIFGHIRR
eukprot:scaffold66686_cov57-Phaeocystis_antarctica.AAC.3